MTHCYIEIHSNKIATHFEDCIANLQKCVAFSDATHGKSNPDYNASINIHPQLFLT